MWRKGRWSLRLPILLFVDFSKGCAESCIIVPTHLILSNAVTFGDKHSIILPPVAPHSDDHFLKTSRIMLALTIIHRYFSISRCKVVADAGVALEIFIECRRTRKIGIVVRVELTVSEHCKQIDANNIIIGASFI